MSAPLVSAVDLRDYAKSRGWHQFQEAVPDRLYVLSHPDFASRQLVFPIDNDAPDSGEAIALAAAKLADLENRPVLAVLQDVEAITDDTLGFHILGDAVSEQSIPLIFAASAMAGAQQLLLSAASSVLKPQRHHPRLGRAEAQQLLRAANFRQTGKGSFILNVSCRVTALDVEAPLFHGDMPWPFVRKTTLLANTAINTLVRAIEADTLDKLVDTTLASSDPILSSNLCEALTRFYDDSLGNGLQIRTSWSPKAPLPANILRAQNTIRIQRDYFSRIEEVRVALKASSTVLEGTFIGTVEELDGDVGEDGRRHGNVTVSLLLRETDQNVSAKLFLSANQYAVAHHAHITDNAYVSVTGKLQSKRQPYVFTDVSDFSLVRNPGSKD